MGRVAYALLIGAIVCQLATLLITWPLWQSRDDPPNLPLFSSLPEISFAWVIVASLIVAAVRPRPGVAIHCGVLATACIFDQYRLEPQFLGIAMLMVACMSDAGLRVCRWYLAAMWIWAGLHKLLSPDWMGSASWWLVARAGWPPDRTYLQFAIAVAASELVLGVLACWRPNWAARLCVAVHLGIVAFMSPFIADTNYSVIPWNIAVAVIGYWIFKTVQQREPVRDFGLPNWELAALVFLLVVPAGFYLGWVDRSFCHVLYSDNLPRGLITNKAGTQRIRRTQALGVPFPNERRLIRQYFERTAAVGDKLHIYEQRPMLDDQFFVMHPSGATEIDEDEFFRLRENEVGGIGLDRRRSVFALSRAGVLMKREEPGAMIYTVAFTPENFDTRLLQYLAGLPNLQQIDFSRTPIQDEDLAHLKSLRLLTGLGLNHTQVTDAGLRHLRELPCLQNIESDGTAITGQGVE